MRDYAVRFRSFRSGLRLITGDTGSLHHRRAPGSHGGTLCVGILDVQTILAHCIYVASGSLVNYPVVDDIGILGATGATVAHSPAAWAGSGITLDSFDSYRKAGVNMALATDAYPLDMFAEMKMTGVMCRKSERNHEAGAARDVFNASNIGGAAALGRPDLGRLQAGCKADIVVVDPASLHFGPAPDPVGMLVELGRPENVDMVMVDGRIVVEGKRLTFCDQDEVIRDAMQPLEPLEQAYAEYHPSGKRLDEQFPHAFRPWTN